MDLSTDSLIAVLAAYLIALVIISGGVYAMATQKVFVDKTTGAVTEIEVKGFGKFKTNVPALGALVIGGLLAYGTTLAYEFKPAKLPLKATITVENPEPAIERRVDILLGVIPQRYRRAQSSVGNGESVNMELNIDTGQDYDVIVYTPTVINPDNGSYQRSVEFGPVKKQMVDGREVRVFEKVLRLE